MSSGVERLNMYVEDVLNHNIITNLYIKQACQRHLNDLKRQGTEEFPYIFDPARANKFIAFTEHCRQFEDRFKGQPLHLENWECFIMGSIFGWVHKDTKFRRFRKAFVFVGRKNGKSTLMASTLLYSALSDNGAQCFTIATKQQQARVVYEVCRQFILQNPALSKLFKIYNSTYRLYNANKASYIAALASDTSKLDGLNPAVVVADELSAMRDYSPIKVLQSGMGARSEALLLEITSGSDNMESPGHSEFQLSKEILAGIKKDETFFCTPYCLDEDDNWTDPKNFIKANPNLNVSISEEWLSKQLQEAINNPRLEGEFRCKNLNQWLNPLTAWIKPKTWSEIMKNSEKYKFDPEQSYVAVGAVDLSKRRDLTVYTICFLQNNHYFFEHHMYFPQEAIMDKLEHSSELWRHWMQKGYVTATPGDSINYEWMYNDIRNSLKEYTIDAILYDPYNAAGLINEFESDVQLIECNQNMKTMSPYTKGYEECIYNKELVDDNPVLEWMHFNCHLYSDPNGNIKAVKEDRDSDKKIDAIITSIMCVGYIKAQIESGDIDMRTPEQIAAETAAYLKRLTGF